MRKIRKTSLSKYLPKHLPDRLTAIGYLTRDEAVARICRYLDTHADYAAAGELVTLFNIDAEELTEAGVPFESVKALENRCFLMRCFKSR